MCRRQHGAAFATYAECKPEDFAWSAGEEWVNTYEARGGDGWVFCTQCGASLAGTRDGVVRNITLGTVEGDPGVRPHCHIFVGSKAVWEDIGDDLPQFDERSP